MTDRNAPAVFNGNGAGTSDTRCCVSSPQQTPSKGSTYAQQHTVAINYVLQNERTKSEQEYRQLLAKDPKDRQAIRSLARLAVAGGALDQAKDWLQKAQDAGVARSQLGVEWAAIYLAAGEIEQARMQVQETVDLQPNSLEAWGLLAVVLLEQKNIEEVEQTVLPRMDAIAGSPDAYCNQIVRAQLAMAKGMDSYRAARAAFLRANTLRPDVTNLNDVILQLDIALADRPSAEQLAQHVLGLNRKHALANYVMGSLRLQAGQYGEAEKYLRRSVETEPLPAALNDLAEVLRRMRKFTDAETFARQVVAKAPDLYVSLETLSSILMDQNRIDEAEPYLTKALALNKDDIRMQVSMARLQYLKGDLARARDIIKLVRNHQDALDPFELAEFEKLANKVEQRLDSGK